MSDYRRIAKEALTEGQTSWTADGVARALLACERERLALSRELLRCDEQRQEWNRRAESAEIALALLRGERVEVREAREDRCMTALEQAQAAYRYFVASGRDWSPWSCKP